MDPQDAMDDAPMKWLAAHGPDEWHQVVISWNWDGGYSVFSWIAAQPACDRATAQFLIIYSEPMFHIRYPNREAVKAFALDGYDFLALMIERWNTGFYSRGEIASEEPDFIKKVQRAYRNALTVLPSDQLPWRLHDDLFEILEGRKVVAEGFTEGYPLEVWEAHAGDY